MNPIFELDFWQKRLDEARKINLLSHSIGMGFNFPLIDKIHEQIIQKEIKKGEKVLDFGCGYGRSSHWFDRDDYVGIDLVPDFIQTAQTMFPEYRFLVHDLRKPFPFKRKEFDWGIGISMKEMIRRDAGQEEWEKIVKNLKKVCKKLLILEYGNSREEEIKKYEVL